MQRGNQEQHADADKNDALYHAQRTRLQVQHILQIQTKTI